MDVERRAARRAPVHMFCNQYIDGTPFLSEALELSMSGALVRRILGPDTARACYALEVGVPEQADERVWICATPIWRVGAFEALKFVAQSAADKLRLASLLGTVAPACH